MAYFRWRRAMELAALDRPWVGELLLRRRFEKPKFTPPEGWNAEYERGEYDRLVRTEQRHHHRLLAGLITDGRQATKVLEIGCGEGVFLESLKSHQGVTYLGVDISSVAIERARARFAKEIAAGTMRFEVGDGSAYPARENFDAIVFPECIEYLDDIVEVMDHYACFLNTGGQIGLSQWMGARPLRLWRRLKAWGKVTNQAVVSADWGGAWLVATLAPRRD
jgi:2-polyprenyl-3-methyl-5-hydroxy-6-metoxy-1,4-benzoquinol methylase